MATSAQEASRLSEQITQILKLISTFHTADLKLEEISHDLRSLALTSQGKINIPLIIRQSNVFTSIFSQIRWKIGCMIGYPAIHILRSTMTFDPAGSQVPGSGS